VALKRVAATAQLDDHCASINWAAHTSGGVDACHARSNHFRLQLGRAIRRDCIGQRKNGARIDFDVGALYETRPRGDVFVKRSMLKSVNARIACSLLEQS
jgi:hypothetical protein